MLKSIAANVLFFGVCVWAKDAAEGDVPYQASVRSGGRHICSGSIISDTWILTSASCLNDLEAYKIHVVVGTIDISGSGQLLLVSQIEKYPEFKQKSDYEYDIALLKVDPIEFNENVQPVSFNKNAITQKDQWTVSGWERRSRNNETTLQTIDANPIPESDCDYFSEIGAKTLFCLQNTEKNTEGQKVFGDIGCPVVGRRKGLQGVIYRMLKRSTSDLIGIGLRVSYFYSWIVDTMNK